MRRGRLRVTPRKEQHGIPQDREMRLNEPRTFQVREKVRTERTANLKGPRRGDWLAGGDGNELLNALSVFDLTGIHVAL
jgi:hypothetical protein